MFLQSATYTPSTALSGRPGQPKFWGSGAVPPDDHPLVWQAAVVALGPMGHLPTEADIAACLRMEGTDRVAVVLAAVLADPVAALGAVVGSSRGAGGTTGAALSLAKRRMELGRLITIVG